jgi:photosystem II stability/assembly factor-like uncharacterized protein
MHWHLRALLASIPVSILSILVVGSTATPGFSQAPLQSSHAWAGTVFDGFTLDGNEVWTVEDGGRIRHRNSAGIWAFQKVPVEVKDPLLRIHFLSDGLHGWAVSKSGHLIRTTDGGANWIWSFRKPGVLPGATFEELWDIFMLDGSIGWMCGLHSIWYTQTGGQTNADWTQVTLLDQNGVPITNPADLEEIELYSLDVALGTNPPILALASAEPGLVFRPLLQPSFDPLTWKVVYDARALCSTPQFLTACQQAMLCPPDDEPFEPWIVTISRNPAHKLALLIGGWGFHCGMILASTDDGVTWTNERHECMCLGPSPPCPPTSPCDSDPLYLNDPSILTDTWRWRTYETQYGGMIIDGNGGAVAVGYGGQTVVRDPSTGVWHDRSETSTDYVHATTAVTMPQRGVVAPPSAGANSVVYVMGLGGFIRRSTNGGQTFGTPHETLGEPWRFGDLWFFDDILAGDHGWMVSQFSRLAESIDGGKHWFERTPSPDMGFPKLNSIAFAVDRFHGAMVGVATNQFSLPKILYTTDGGSTRWLAPTHDIPPTYDGIPLLDVCWASNTVAWAAGSKGLIVRSTNGGELWRHQLPEPFATSQYFEIHGVAFADTTTGLFVGQRPAMTPPGVGSIYQWRKIGSTVTWTAVSLDDVPAIKVVTDVAISGTDAYAVGYRESNNVRTGVVLHSTSGPSGFTSFSTIKLTPECDVLEVGDGGAILNEVEILPNGDVMVGGDCGRVWQLKQSGSTWMELKSSLSSHICGMSFPRSDLGYVGGQRHDLLGNSHAITRFDF